MPLRARADGRVVAQGQPQWHERRSARPYEDWHLTPEQVGSTQTTILIDRPLQAHEIDHAAGGPVLIVALASTDDEGARADLDTAHAAVQYAAARPDARAVVVALGKGAAHYQEKKTKVAAAYSGGGRVVDLTGTTGRLPPSEGQVEGARPATPGTVVLFTGLSGSGKSTIARAVRNWLIEQGQTVTLLDGDLVRRHLSAGLGFSRQDRDRNILRIGWVAAEIAAHGGLAIASPIAPFEETREQVRHMAQERGGRFLLVHMATPLAECERRDRKGLYARARRGEIPEFTGISSPYEEPPRPDLRLNTTNTDVRTLRNDVLYALGYHPGRNSTNAP